MSSKNSLDTRVFNSGDQRRFAELTGDVNPMHLDPLYARRTQAGTTVVHGMHAVLWALERLAERGLSDRPTGLKVRFEKFIPVDQLVQAHLTPDGLELVTSSGRGAVLTLTYDARPSRDPIVSEREAETTATPARLDMPELTSGEGAISPISPPEAFRREFPNLTKAIGTQSVIDLAMLSTVVGMHCPGLHSIFSKVNVTISSETQSDGRLHYRIHRAQPVFRHLEIAVSGAVSGVIEAFVRRPPVNQATSAQLRGAVTGMPYAGSRVLVVGGSRGLGEIVAKLSALGGAHVTITYAVGAADAEAVAVDIRSAGGICEVRRLDIREPTSDQSGLDWGSFTHVYYFATTQIYKQRSSFYSETELAICFDVHVSGLYRLCELLMADPRREPVRLFYPSSVFVEEQPREMLEYVMAKASGEFLCAAMPKFWPLLKTVAVRLPRIETDQTATVLPLKNAAALDALLPVLAEMNA